MLSLVSHQDEISPREKMLRGLTPALHALKLDARVRQTPWAALLPYWTISIIDGE